MNLFEMFNQVDQVSPFTEGSWDPQTHEPQYQDASKMTEYYSMYKLQQPSYAIEGYISPYATNNWDTSSGILNYIDDNTRLPALDQKMDPNRIFTSDIASLRALASDQNKIVKMFEKRLVESLADKSKFGLTEDDIEAMQALTAARAAIVNINKEQIQIKKNIADIKLKQQQQSGMNNQTGNGGPIGNNVSGIDVGRSFMDKIFDMPARQPATDLSYNAPSVSLDQASQMIDNLIPSVNDVVSYESAAPTTYVVVGDSDEDVEFATYDSTGQLISDYPNPTSHIESVDRENRRATDDLLVSYPVKFKN